MQPGFELRVKVGLEQILGDRVRCRTARTRPGRKHLGWPEAVGYLAVLCRDFAAVEQALTGLSGVVGWIPSEGADRSRARRTAQPASQSADGIDAAVAWLDPRGLIS